MDRHDRMDYVRGTARSRDSSPSRVDSARVDSRVCASPGLAPQLPTPSKALPGNLSKGEKIAMSVSKAADPLKPKKRKGTQDSDMSFGMTDLAPPGAMQACESCSRPTEGYLINGLCKQCHELHQKVAKAKRDGK